MSSPFHRLIRGKFIVVGKEPDGDSVRFVADDLDLWSGLRNGHRIRPNQHDGSVQLRFEGVDAPELHYGTAAQPLGREARDALLEWMGFGQLQFAGNTVTSADPTEIRGAVLSKAAEKNGRPVSFVLLDADAPAGNDGAWIEVDKAILDKTINRRLLHEGTAYGMNYTSTPLQDELRQAAGRARRLAQGVWAVDSTPEFVLADQNSIGPAGSLILPKLFRRCTDYLRDVDKGLFDGNLDEWLVFREGPPRFENDMVVVLPNQIEVRLSELVVQENRTVRLQADLLDLVFVEK